MDAPKILFLTVGDPTWASSRMRSYWPARLIPGSKAMQWKAGDEIPDEFDAYVWMKTGNLEIMRQIRRDGKLQFLEVCDPSWWWQPRETREMADECTAIVAASEPARQDWIGWYGDNMPVHVIPDRLDLDHFPLQKVHQHADPVRFIWYGVSVNRIALFAALAFLERLTADGVNIEVTVCDNQPDQPWKITEYFPMYHVRWSLEQENRIIASHDIALVPPYPGPWGALKTNNRMLTAYACGLPTTDAQDYAALYDLATSAEARKTWAEWGYSILKDKYLIQNTATQWLEIVGEAANAVH